MRCFKSSRHKFPVASLASVVMALSACTPSSENISEDIPSSRFEELSALFANANVLAGPKIVDCKLSGGTETKCFSVTTGPAPANHKTGPYCPRTISDTTEQAGTWFVNDELYDVDGKFIEQLAVIYEDNEWQMYDLETGKVNLVEGQLGCDVAGDPNSASDYKNFCVECEVKYLDPTAGQTYVFPLEPVVTDGEPARIGPNSGIGLAFNGVKLDAPAPMHLILGSHTLGLFDACAGHVNPSTGYHYHGLVGCEPEKATTVSNHTPLVAVAMDGFDIYATSSESDAASLDECGGHAVDGLDYHYHAEAAGSNQFIGCFKAESGCTLGDPSATCDASANTGRRGPPPGGGPRPDGGQRPEGETRP